MITGGSRRAVLRGGERRPTLLPLSLPLLTWTTSIPPADSIGIDADHTVTALVPQNVILLSHDINVTLLRSLIT